MVSGSVSGPARDVREHGHHGRVDHHVAERVAHRFGGRLHQRRMERSGDGQGHRTLRAHLLRNLDHPVDRALVTRQHNLARIVVVGDRRDFALRRDLRDAPRECQVCAEEGRHCALTDGHGLLHCLSAQLQQLCGGRQVE